ncbi:MAG: hypothetical protein PHU51_01550 [Candidatus Nanoarchaeia archaeon]|nr:hypothetical protein [Candidatus Nanoarchaeia archaeon]
MEIFEFRKDPTKIEYHYQKTILHVSANENKLSKLKFVLQTMFKEPFSFKSKQYGINDENTEYLINGTLNNTPYTISLKYVCCPNPFSNSQNHRASVVLPEDKVDEITSVIEIEFKKYASELKSHLNDLI